jgi:CRP/FNR family transcriptional regulator, cyclic AMP receptor protein
MSLPVPASADTSRTTVTRTRGTLRERDARVSEAAIATLRRSDLFRSLDDAAAAVLVRNLVRRRYAAGEVVFHLGDPGDRLHVIESGRVRIAMAADDGREGTLTVLGAGAMFGELALLDGSVRSATAIAMESTQTVTLDRLAFRMLLSRDDAIREAVLAGVARWLRRVTDQVAELHFLDLRGRVAAALVRLARDAAPRGATQGSVTLPPLTQADIASLAAGTRQRVNVALGELIRAGLIASDGRRITVLDIARLEDHVGW